MRSVSPNLFSLQKFYRTAIALITMFMAKTIGTFMPQFERKCHALDTQMPQILFIEQGKMRVSLQAKTSQTMKQRLNRG